MWIVFIFGIAAVALYEFSKGGGGGPATCGICYAEPDCGCSVSCDGSITADRATWPTGDRVWDVCRAVALAEGANVEGSAPDRNNNPGDLSRGDEHGQAVAGYVTLDDGEDAIIFETKAGGWQALYTKFNNIRLGISKAYSPKMTWQNIAAIYAGDSADWVANVTRELGVQPTDTYGSYFE